MDKGTMQFGDLTIKIKPLTLGKIIALVPVIESISNLDKFALTNEFFDNVLAIIEQGVIGDQNPGLTIEDIKSTLGLPETISLLKEIFDVSGFVQGGQKPGENSQM